MNYISSTQLWIGSVDDLKKHIALTIQHHYCPYNACGTCCICTQINAEEYYAYIAVSTSKSLYSRSDFDTIFNKISFQGTPQEPIFCVIHQAEKLSHSCANSLLKLLEEPPVGWHWILLTDRPHELLDTVTSRCLVKKVPSLGDTIMHNELYILFTSAILADHVSFQNILERSKITEYESRLVYDAILAYWTERSYTDARLGPWVNFLHSFLSMQPMPGSNKFFWRTVYLNMSCLVG